MSEQGKDFFSEEYFKGTSGDRGEFSLVDIEPKYLDRLAFLKTLLTPEEKRRELQVLDVGAGAATVARANEQLKDDKINMRVVSSDFSSAGVTQLTQADRPPFLQADIYQLPIKNNSLDGITAWDIIEHLDEPERALEGLRDAIKPNGFLHIITPNPDAYTRGTDAFTYRRDRSHVWPPIISVDFFQQTLPRLGFDTQVYTRGFANTGGYLKQHGTDLIKPANIDPTGTHIIAFGRKMS